MKTAWRFETGLIWSCPYCGKMITSKKEKLPIFHRYCGACGRNMFGKDKWKNTEGDPDES